MHDETAGIQTTNPATGEALAFYAYWSQSQLKQALLKAEAAQKIWANVPLEAKKQTFLALAQLLDAKQHALACLMTQEMGKPISQSLRELGKCAKHIRFYAEHAESYLRGETLDLDGDKAITCFEPLGVILGVMPWNFPAWQVLRAAIPTLLLGNGFFLKHAPICTGSGLFLQRCFEEAGFVEGLFQSAVLNNAQTKQALEHTVIRGLTFTGSYSTGRILASYAGSCVKPSVLELGGSDAYLVLEDADITKSVKELVSARLDNAGQVCVSPKRILVAESRYEAFCEQALAEMKTYQYAEPMQDSTVLGPMARQDLRLQLHRQVEQAIRLGARLLAGGAMPEGRGFFYPATILDFSPLGSIQPDEEFFGPVFSVCSVADEAEMIAQANHSVYGLGAGVFSRDIARAECLAQQLQAGSIAINMCVRSDSALPFGGVKDSGYGRELGIYGLKSFANIKTIRVAHDKS